MQLLGKAINSERYSEALKNAIEGRLDTKKVEIVRPLSVVIMGHGYNLFDERLSMNLIKKLEKMNIKVYTGLNVSKEDAIKSIHNLSEIQYWANELDLTGTASYYMLNNKVNIEIDNNPNDGYTSYIKNDDSSLILFFNNDYLRIND